MIGTLGGFIFMHFNDDFPKWLFRKAQFRERKEKHFLEATFLAPRRIYIYNSSIFWNGVLFKDKNAFYTISANVSSFGLCIKDILQLNMHLLADWPESILFKNNNITILQKVYDGQDQQGILIILFKKKWLLWFHLWREMEVWKCSETIPREGWEFERPAGDGRDLVEHLKAPSCLVSCCKPFCAAPRWRWQEWGEDNGAASSLTCSF